MTKNSNLHEAKVEKNDEFYTRFEDIESECDKYRNQFVDKVIYCNCDDPLQSNFFRYFAERFNILKLKKLIATCYNKGLTNPYRQESLFGDEWGDTEVIHQTLGVKVCPNRAFKIEMNQGDLYDFNGDGRVNADDVIAIIRNDLETGTNKLVSYLDGDGDFRSDECVDILKECDIVVTNPPFSCYSSDTEVMTNNGWKLISDVDITTDVIMSLNPDTKSIEMVKAIDFIKSPVNDNLYHFSNSNMDFCVTGNHKMYAEYRTNNNEYLPIPLIDASNVKKSHLLPLCGFGWKGDDVNVFTLPETSQLEQFTRKNIIVGKKVIPMLDWLEFFGFYLADGCYRDHINSLGKRDYTISIKQNKQNEDYVIDLIKRIGFTPRISNGSNDSNCNYNIYSKQLWEYLSQFGRSSDKYIPREILSLDKKYLEALLNGYMHGDSSMCKDGHIHFSSVSKKLIENIQELLLKIYGRVTQITEYNRKHSYDDKCGVCYHINIKLNKNRDTYTKYGIPELIPYNDYVYCLTLEKNHIMLIRHSDKIGWCGNCFRDFISTMEKYEKKYLVVGNNNAITYKEIFPLIKENKLWLGYNSVKEFIKPDGTTQKFGNINWFTNLDTFKRHEEFYFSPANEFSLENYPLYDNYDAFNVDEVKRFPYEKKITLTVKEDRYNTLKATYENDLELIEEKDGNYTIIIDRPIFGVPITFLDKYNPDEFEIVAFRKGSDGQDLVFTAERESSTVLSNPCSTAKDGLITGAKHTICTDGKSRYGRIAIRRK